MKVNVSVRMYDEVWSFLNRYRFSYNGECFESVQVYSGDVTDVFWTLSLSQTTINTTQRRLPISALEPTEAGIFTEVSSGKLTALCTHIILFVRCICAFMKRTRRKRIVCRCKA